MIGTLIGLIFVLIIVGLVWWAAKRVLLLIPLEEPFKTLVYVVSVVLLACICLWIASVFLAMAGIHVNYGGFH